MVMVDDSHAVGIVGDHGRGTPELAGVMDRVDIITGTLGKALGGASGGYTGGPPRDRSTGCGSARGRTCSPTAWRRSSHLRRSACSTCCSRGDELRAQLERNAAAVPRRAWTRPASRSPVPATRSSR